MFNQIYPSELQINHTSVFNTETLFLDLHLSISDGFVSAKIYAKQDYFYLDIVDFSFLDGDVSRSPSYCGIFLNFFVLLECPVVLMTLIFVIKFCNKTFQTRL